MNADGSGKSSVMEGTIVRWSPRWSPDGSTLLLNACPKSAETLDLFDIFAVDINGGSAPVNLTGSLAQYPDIMWSPDGSQIAFTSNRDSGGGTELYMIEQDGTELTRLTRTPLSVLNFAPIPSQGLIAYAAGNPGNCNIYLIDIPFSSTTEPVTTRLDVENVSHPAWSPDGLKMVYRQPGALCVMDYDGSNPQQLAEVPAEVSAGDVRCSWSPDSSMLFYTVNNVLYITHADGSNPQQLAEVSSDGEGSSFSWSPDGLKLAYCDDGGLLSVNSDGSNLQRLANGPISRVAWSPDGSRLAYSFAGVLAKHGMYSLYTIDADGENQQLIDSNYYYRAEHPLRWISNSRVIFNSSGVWHTANADGSDWQPVNIADYESVSSSSRYKQQVAYQLVVGDNTDIYISDEDGQNEVRLTDHAAVDSSPKWVTFDMGGMQTTVQQT